MPLFMDRHEVPGASAQDVANAHVSDLAVAGRYGVEFFSYWFDSTDGEVFCFARAPSTSAVERVHGESHGLIPAEIIEVSENDVVRFLGKVSDPANASEITSPFRTIVFTDLEDSTGLLERIGDSLFMLLLTEHDLVVRRALVDWHGREVKHTGDGFLLSFADVSNALSWSLRVRDDFADRTLVEGVPPVRVRIGMAAGEPVDHDDDIFGASVNRANRICAVAEPGHILVSDLVRDLGLEQGYLFGEEKAVSLKGIRGDALVYELVGPDSSGHGVSHRG
jgi:class 3 adenylate cyclase